jgi:hypothetical protein
MGSELSLCEGGNDVGAGAEMGEGMMELSRKTALFDVIKASLLKDFE